MGIIERRIREKKQRIDEIVAAAKRTFQEKGFSKATMNDVADSSDLSRRTVYMYFKSKEELSLSVASLGLNSLVETIEAELKKEGLTLGRIKNLFDHYTETFATDPGSFRFLLSFANTIKMVGPDHELSISCEKALNRMSRAVAALFDQGAADGTLRHFDDSLQSAKVVLLLINSTIETAVVSSDMIGDSLGTDPVEFLKTVFEILTVYISSK